MEASASEHEHHPHPHDPPTKHGLLDDVDEVDYDTGDGYVKAIVVRSTGDPHMKVLGQFENGVLHLIKNGDPIPEREGGGGVTWTRL